MRRAILLLALLVTSVLAATMVRLPVSAVDAPSQSISLSPALTELSINPGETASRTLEVNNNGDLDFNITLSVAPYSVENIVYDPNFTLLPGATEVTSWVDLPSGATEVSSRGIYKAAYSITVPAGTAPGGYYAVIFAETTPSGDEDAGGVVARNRVGNILYITVKGTIETGGSVTDVPLNGFLMQDSVPLGVLVQNTGGTHFASTIKLNVDNIFGGRVFTSDLERFILPQTERRVSVDWAPTSPVGIYKVYRSATINGEEKSLPVQTIIHIQPWFAGIIGIMFAIIVISVIIRVTVRRKKRAREAKED